jgi:hypothetical protein
MEDFMGKSTINGRFVHGKTKIIPRLIAAAS